MQEACRRFRSVRLLVIVGNLTLCGCDSVIAKVYLKRRPAPIYVMENLDAISNCNFVKHVRSRNGWGGLFLQDEALERAVSDLTHESAQAGGNVLVIREKSKSFMGSSASGDAYLCKELGLPPEN